MKSRLFIFFSALLIVVSLWMVFIYVPTDKDSGDIQRIFYFHVPLAWVAFLAYLMVFVWSIVYLATRDAKWDLFASASAEVGLVFTTLVLITGSIWARPVWGVWWTWDARLTTALVLWLIYIAYFLIRSYVPDEERRARFSAVVGIAGFIDVPIVALAIVIARTQHPGAIVFRGGLEDPRMLPTLLVSLLTFTVLYFVLLSQRVGIKRAENILNKIKMG